LALEVYSPIPMTAGESIVFGLSTKHIVNFMIGLAVSSPIVFITVLVSPYMHVTKLWSLLIGGLFGLMFAGVQVKNRALAEYLWLSIKYSRRPKVILFDRDYRIRTHREMAQKKGGATN
jgi:hypothetical protein